MANYAVKFTKKGSVERTYHCDACGIRALARVSVEASGSTRLSPSMGYADDASKYAHEEFRSRSIDVLGLVRCPRCQERNGVGVMKLGIAWALLVTLGSAALLWNLRASFLTMGPLFVLIWGVRRLHRWFYLWGAANKVTFEDIRAGQRIPLPRAEVRRSQNDG